MWALGAPALVFVGLTELKRELLHVNSTAPRLLIVHVPLQNQPRHKVVIKFLVEHGHLLLGLVAVNHATVARKHEQIHVL